MKSLQHVITLLRSLRPGKTNGRVYTFFWILHELFFFVFLLPSLLRTGQGANN